MRKPILVLALVTGLGLAGCGGDKPDTSADRTYTDGAATASTATTPTPAQTTPTTETVEPGAPVVPTNYKAFQSPSGNIGCAVTDEGVAQVRCDVREHTFEAPAKPSDCDLDYGGGLMIAAGLGPRFVCAGDTTLGSGPVLKYGEVNEVGSISCTSREAGITCLDKETGRGFFLSRDSYKLL